MNLQWEEVEGGMHRSPVPGGWIVRQYDDQYSEQRERWEPNMVGLCFVPDEAHIWGINAATRKQKAGEGEPLISPENYGGSSGAAQIVPTTSSGPDASPTCI